MNHTQEPDEDDVRYGPALEWGAPNLTLEQKQALVEGWVLHQLLGEECKFIGDTEVRFPSGVAMSVEVAETTHDVKIYPDHAMPSLYFRPETASHLAEVFYDRRHKDAVEGAVRAIHLSHQPSKP